MISYETFVEELDVCDSFTSSLIHILAKASIRALLFANFTERSHEYRKLQIVAPVRQLSIVA